MDGGIGIIEMLKKTNILALVGGGKNPYNSPNKFTIWDDHQGRVISQIRLNKNIINIRLRADKIITITEDKIFIFNINTLEKENCFDTFENTLGIIGISPGINNKLIIAFPVLSQGNVFIKNIINTELAKTGKIINAHESKIKCLSINKEGNLLATASDKGTLIRIFSLINGESIAEFRRGTKNVEMTCISFDNYNKFIGCISDAGTIHIFSIGNAINKKTIDNGIIENKEQENETKKGLFGKVTGMLKIKNPFSDTERSFAKFRIPDTNSLLAFGQENTFVVITTNGKYYSATFDPNNGGDCYKISEKDFLKDEN